VIWTDTLQLAVMLGSFLAGTQFSSLDIHKEGCDLMFRVS